MRPLATNAAGAPVVLTYYRATPARRFTGSAEIIAVVKVERTLRRDGTVARYCATVVDQFTDRARADRFAASLNAGGALADQADALAGSMHA
jgi:hypothetical protein